LLQAAVVQTHQISQHSLFHRWGIPRLIFQLTLVFVQVAVVAAAVARGIRAGLPLRLPAMGIVVFRLGFLVTLLPDYLGAVQRLGLSVHSLRIILDYIAFALALFFLLADWLARHRAALESSRETQIAF
jgi:hypothetical protein